MAQQQIVKDERSIGELFTELAGETSSLIRQEIALAQTEISQKAVKAATNAGYLVVGGLVGFIALQAIVTAIIVGLAYFMPLWAAALIVGIIIGIAAAILINSAVNTLKNMNFTPQETVETLKEDAQWLKKQI